MTVEPEAAAPAPHRRLSPSDFAGFAELRAAHLGLRSSLAETGHGDGSARRPRGFASCMAQTQRTGAVLLDPAMRKAAQGILDYWCAELAGLPDAKAGRLRAAEPGAAIGASRGRSSSSRDPRPSRAGMTSAC